MGLSWTTSFMGPSDEAGEHSGQSSESASLSDGTQKASGRGSPSPFTHSTVLLLFNDPEQSHGCHGPAHHLGGHSRNAHDSLLGSGLPDAGQRSAGAEEPEPASRQTGSEVRRPLPHVAEQGDQSECAQANSSSFPSAESGPAESKTYDQATALAGPPCRSR